MAKKQGTPNNKAINKELVDWRLNELEEKVQALENGQDQLTLKVTSVATKVAIIGSIIGAIGSALIQKYWK